MVVGFATGAADGTEGAAFDEEDGTLDRVVEGADITGEKKGFNLSTETVQGFPAHSGFLALLGYNKTPIRGLNSSL